MLENIRASFHSMDKDMMRKIITIMMRPKLGNATAIWPLHINDIRKLERIQRITTKMVPEHKNTNPYGEIETNEHTYTKAVKRKTHHDQNLQADQQVENY